MSQTAIDTIRADHVGSLIRPAGLLKARADYDAAGGVGQKPDALIEAENKSVADVVAMQERAGMQLVTDGEMRRISYSRDFQARLGGLTAVMNTDDFTFVNGNPTTKINITGKITWPDGGIQVTDFEYLNSVTNVTPKVSIPSPLHAQFFEDGDNIDKSVYAEPSLYWDDLVAVYIKELGALYAAGCRYVQMDETTFVKLCDPKFVTGLKDRGGDPIAALTHWIDIINRIEAGAPDDMTVAVHFCRGNGLGGAWISEGGYDAIAETLFSTLKIKRLLLEYDSDRAGGFEPLRFIPKGVVAVLGLMTTKSPELEPADALKSRIDEAAKSILIDQLAISPQCGFASGKSGGQMSIDQQEQKLARIAEVAADVWG
ncbi:MAG: 5-methyltetrahydropteroyltriglutamate--homocysteine S-methyltransferase [Rhodospirillaceae bacterium]|nr:5-methyltetrahydropteroyltriglutamate--homocysteine S-methyltransferase [Rhodospirillaceae bacterium]MBT3885564.1 5-methyltetrahydropteroyltriglutamate--homocysteine S-methyltransferase [Rhodospirillaceae bacterium]MBT4118404.1 5-methyltetrahydropteroyltriglutamate--homocysteine S-methyltransferase [Rhodospirillaceae bacterium]MBT4671860.1 5-methyltetrahydropteroyltriglutamate--homocysteine S-methyltransferase [Rhodospirillaceae bacterium]MBT4751872.1 5-methyltetrahydropteroyltriglutamate--h